MNQKFKFGDRVRCQFLGECVVINSSEHFCYVMNEKGDYNTIANPEHLELIPHPDTVRLDFMLKNQFVATLSEDTDDDFFIVQAQLSRQATTFGRGCTPREAIDHAIKQEQPNETT